MGRLLLAILGKYILDESNEESDDDDMTQWTRREYPKSEIDRQASSLIPWWNDKGEPANDDIGKAYAVIQNWRNSHALPLLTFRMGLTKRARKVEQNVIIAQRLKRFVSILNKLSREPTMKISQMQDLGGCRAIFHRIDSVIKVADFYREAPYASESGLKCYDYIQSPKPDGYRGIHVVGRYRARVEKNEIWNGQRVEIQLRSQLQHAFATAVETATTFTQSQLKSGGGEIKWRRFFALTSSAIAVREGCPIVPDTPERVDDLVGELRELTRELKVRQLLKGWTDAVKTLPKSTIDKASWLLLVLDIEGKTIKVTGFTDRKKAGKELSAIERDTAAQVDAVLVWVSSINKLKSAYPNYYADTAAFLSALDFSLGRGNLQRIRNETKAK